jgi:protein arginine N-methyltransferase 3
MVPSQTRIMMAGMTGERLYEEGFDFWNKVYGKVEVDKPCFSSAAHVLPFLLRKGFDLSPMKPTKFEDGIIEVVDAEELVTSECPLTVRNCRCIVCRKTLTHATSYRSNF